MNLEEMCSDLTERITSFKHFYNKSDPKLWISVNDKRVRVKLYTKHNSYAIVAHPDDGSGSYLGCVASARTPRAGEDWTRGSDLADGCYSDYTWVKILGDIVGYELVEINRGISEPSPLGGATPLEQASDGCGPTEGED